MEFTPLGDCAIIAVVGLQSDAATLDKVSQLARTLATEPLPGITDIVPAFTTVTVHYDPARVPEGAGLPHDRVVRWLGTAAKMADRRKPAPGREVEIPVRYGGEYGPDLAEVAAHAKMTEAEVIRLHSGARYRVAAVGFAPGFPYLLGLPARLHMPRRATPRLTVPVGSVGIGGAQAGVYPMATPGGWSLIGRTPLRLFRPEAGDKPTLLAAGDTVKFIPVTEKDHAWAEVATEAGTVANYKVSKQTAVLEVVKPGVLTTVQDLGREGWQQHGISSGGAMDRRAARVANLLLGNPEDAPVLEATLVGPELKFNRTAWIAVTGAEVRGVAGWKPLQVGVGSVVSLAEFTRGARAYVAIAGGFEVPRVLGGAGTLLRAQVGGWNGRALLAGDRLAARAVILDTGASWSAASEFRTVGEGEIRVRVVRGPQWSWFSGTARRALLAKSYKISSQSDRMGLRLEGPALKLDEDRDLISEGVGFGTVQVPPDGQPIVLMADRQTLGGYPKIAHVIAFDLPLLAQARTGDTVVFEEISLADAQALHLNGEQSLALLRAGIASKLR